MNWNLWPAAQLINISMVPINMRIVFVNVISVGKLISGSRLDSTETEPFLRSPATERAPDEEGDPVAQLIQSCDWGKQEGWGLFGPNVSRNAVGFAIMFPA
jgi:hypothetical protein